MFKKLARCPEDTDSGSRAKIILSDIHFADTLGSVCLPVSPFTDDHYFDAIYYCVVKKLAFVRQAVRYGKQYGTFSVLFVSHHSEKGYRNSAPGVLLLQIAPFLLEGCFFP